MKRTTVTLLDLARELGLDKSSISLALRESAKISPATRLRVQETARRLGYRPHLAARQLSAASPQILALVLSSGFSALANEVVVATVQKLAASTAASGAVFTLLASEALVAAARGERNLPLLPDGLWAWGDLPAGDAATIGTLNVPLVILDPNDMSYAATPGIAVMVDNEGGAAALARHLAAQGAERLLFVQAQRAHLGHEQRRLGALAGWRETRPPKSFSAASLDELSDVELRAFVKPGKGAIFCSNDQAALQVWHRLTQAGVKVPETVLLAGFDGDRAALLLGLTTALFDSQALGEQGFELLRRRIQTPDAPAGPVLVPVTLRPGRSTMTL